MNHPKHTVTGYILAGGKSSRMGTDKGLILFKGKAIIQHVIEQLQPVTEKVVIVSNNPEYKKFDVEVIPDLIRDFGPAGGIYTALSHSKTEQNFVLSCDTPFVTTAAIEYMLQNANQSQITLTTHEGRLEPLFGVYTKSCLVQWDIFIQKGFLKLKDIVSSFDLLQLNIDNNPLFDNNFFMNINTPEDLKKIIINTYI
jgi:molybdopterin-guanine dinucleotide biosynthesis protein A